VGGRDRGRLHDPDAPVARSAASDEVVALVVAGLRRHRHQLGDTSPQMFYAWTVAVRETQAQAIADLVARLGAALETQGKGTVTPGTPK